MRLTKTEAMAIAKKIRHSLVEALEKHWEDKFNTFRNSPDFQRTYKEAEELIERMQQYNIKAPDSLKLSSFSVQGGYSIYLSNGNPLGDFVKTVKTSYLKKRPSTPYEESITSDVIYASIESKSLDDLIARLSKQYLDNLMDKENK